MTAEPFLNCGFWHDLVVQWRWSQSGIRTTATMTHLHQTGEGLAQGFHTIKYGNV